MGHHETSTTVPSRSRFTFLQITQSYKLPPRPHSNIYTFAHLHTHHTHTTEISIVMFSSRFDINAAGWLVQSTFDDIGIQQKKKKSLTNVIMTSLFATLTT